ncbi:MAG TPA: response regulator [Leptospiraceae bacterium]|nr:response regulator [Leptospiraceae bacterium]
MVDDDEINLFLTKSMINKILPNGIIFEATNAESAIEQFQAEKPNIIFMDVQMPEMNGHEATIAIRKLETNSRIPIIALTAGARDEEINKCFQSGMDDYVSKPAVADTIEIILAKWLNDN